MVSTLNRTPERLWASGGDDTGFAVLAGRSAAKQELRVLIANYEISALNMGPIPGGNEETLFTGPIIIPPIGLHIPAPGIALGKMTYLDRLTIHLPEHRGVQPGDQEHTVDWGSLTVKQYRIDNANNMKLGGDLAGRQESPAGGPVTVAGSWEPGPPTIVGDVVYDAVGVAPGIDMIVVTGSTGSIK